MPAAKPWVESSRREEEFRAVLGYVPMHVVLGCCVFNKQHVVVCSVVVYDIEEHINYFRGGENKYSRLYYCGVHLYTRSALWCEL